MVSWKEGIGWNGIYSCQGGSRWGFLFKQSYHSWDGATSVITKGLVIRKGHDWGIHSTAEQSTHRQHSTAQQAYQLFIESVSWVFIPGYICTFVLFCIRLFLVCMGLWYVYYTNNNESWLAFACNMLCTRRAKWPLFIVLGIETRYGGLSRCFIYSLCRSIIAIVGDSWYISSYLERERQSS